MRVRDYIEGGHKPPPVPAVVQDPEPETVVDDSLQTYTKTVLKAMAIKRGLSVLSRDTKQRIIDLLEE